MGIDSAAAGLWNHDLLEKSLIARDCEELRKCRLYTLPVNHEICRPAVQCTKSTEVHQNAEAGERVIHTENPLYFNFVVVYIFSRPD